ncbi:MAG: HNH endonuclease family protein [Humibacillus sp.]|nr:HNH endonuclease family protein [Humibacillus sp.]
MERVQIAQGGILHRDLTAVTVKPATRGCVVAAGQLADPYTGQSISYRRGQSPALVNLDHVVSLGDSWQKGAQQLSADQRRNFANDPLNLLAVGQKTNAAKSDSDAATWLPPNRGFWCVYAARQIQVKAKYHLWVTTAEKAALDRIFTSCTRTGGTR